MLIYNGLAGEFYVSPVVVPFHLHDLLDAYLFRNFFGLLQFLSLLLSVLQNDLLLQCDHLLVVLKLELARLFGLLLTQFVLDLEPILHPQTQLL